MPQRGSEHTYQVPSLGRARSLQRDRISGSVTSSLSRVSSMRMHGSGEDRGDPLEGVSSSTSVQAPLQQITNSSGQNNADGTCQESRSAAELIPYHLQGDEQLYDAEQLARRVALKGDKTVRALLDLFWITYFPRGSVRRAITFQEYRELYIKMSKALLEPQHFDIRVVVERLRDDWKRDTSLFGNTRGVHAALRQGKKRCGDAFSGAQDDVENDEVKLLQYGQFLQSQFELVDTWTTGVEKKEYVNFLAQLFFRVAKAGFQAVDTASLLSTEARTEQARAITAAADATKEGFESQLHEHAASCSDGDAASYPAGETNDSEESKKRPCVEDFTERSDGEGSGEKPGDDEQLQPVEAAGTHNEESQLQPLQIESGELSSQSTVAAVSVASTRDNPIFNSPLHQVVFEILMGTYRRATAATRIAHAAGGGFEASQGFVEERNLYVHLAAQLCHKYKTARAFAQVDSAKLQNDMELMAFMMASDNWKRRHCVVREKQENVFTDPTLPGGTETTAVKRNKGGRRPGTGVIAHDGGVFLGDAVSDHTGVYTSSTRACFANQVKNIILCAITVDSEFQGHMPRNVLRVCDFPGVSFQAAKRIVASAALFERDILEKKVGGEENPADAPIGQNGRSGTQVSTVAGEYDDLFVASPTIHFVWRDTEEIDQKVPTTDELDYIILYAEQASQSLRRHWTVKKERAKARAVAKKAEASAAAIKALEEAKQKAGAERDADVKNSDASEGCVDNGNSDAFNDQGEEDLSEKETKAKADALRLAAILSEQDAAAAALTSDEDETSAESKVDGKDSVDKNHEQGESDVGLCVSSEAVNMNGVPAADRLETVDSSVEDHTVSAVHDVILRDGTPSVSTGNVTAKIQVYAGSVNTKGSGRVMKRSFYEQDTASDGVARHDVPGDGRHRSGGASESTPGRDVAVESEDRVPRVRHNETRSMKRLVLRSDGTEMRQDLVQRHSNRGGRQVAATQKPSIRPTCITPVLDRPGTGSGNDLTTNLHKFSADEAVVRAAVPSMPLSAWEQRLSPIGSHGTGLKHEEMVAYGDQLKTGEWRARQRSNKAAKFESVTAIPLHGHHAVVSLNRFRPSKYGAFRDLRAGDEHKDRGSRAAKGSEEVAWRGRSLADRTASAAAMSAVPSELTVSSDDRAQQKRARREMLERDKARHADELAWNVASGRWHANLERMAREEAKMEASALAARPDHANWAAFSGPDAHGVATDARLMLTANGNMLVGGAAPLMYSSPRGREVSRVVPLNVSPASSAGMRISQLSLPQKNSRHRSTDDVVDATTTLVDDGGAEVKHQAREVERGKIHPHDHGGDGDVEKIQHVSSLSIPKKRYIKSRVADARRGRSSGDRKVDMSLGNGPTRTMLSQNRVDPDVQSAIVAARHCVATSSRRHGGDGESDKSTYKGPRSRPHGLPELVGEITPRNCLHTHYLEGGERALNPALARKQDEEYQARVLYTNPHALCGGLCARGRLNGTNATHAGFKDGRVRYESGMMVKASARSSGRPDRRPYSAGTSALPAYDPWPSAAEESSSAVAVLPADVESEQQRIYFMKPSRTKKRRKKEDDEKNRSSTMVAKSVRPGVVPTTNYGARKTREDVSVSRKSAALPRFMTARARRALVSSEAHAFDDLRYAAGKRGVLVYPVSSSHVSVREEKGNGRRGAASVRHGAPPPVVRISSLRTAEDGELLPEPPRGGSNVLPLGFSVADPQGNDVNVPLGMLARKESMHRMASSSTKLKGQVGPTGAHIAPMLNPLHPNPTLNPWDGRHAALAAQQTPTEFLQLPRISLNSQRGAIPDAVFNRSAGRVQGPWRPSMVLRSDGGDNTCINQGLGERARQSRSVPLDELNRMSNMRKFILSRAKASVQSMTSVLSSDRISATLGDQEDGRTDHFGYDAEGNVAFRLDERHTFVTDLTTQSRYAEDQQRSRRITKTLHVAAEQLNTEGLQEQREQRHEGPSALLSKSRVGFGSHVATKVASSGRGRKNQRLAAVELKRQLQELHVTRLREAAEYLEYLGRENNAALSALNSRLMEAIAADHNETMHMRLAALRRDQLPKDVTSFFLSPLAKERHL